MRDYVRHYLPSCENRPTSRNEFDARETSSVRQCQCLQCGMQVLCARHQISYQAMSYRCSHDTRTKRALTAVVAGTGSRTAAGHIVSRSPRSLGRSARVAARVAENLEVILHAANRFLQQLRMLPTTDYTLVRASLPSRSTAPPHLVLALRRRCAARQRSLRAARVYFSDPKVNSNRSIKFAD